MLTQKNRPKLFGKLTVNVTAAKLLVMVIVFGAGFACTEQTETYTTFEGDMIFSYLEKKPEQYSEFVEIIRKAGLKGMLNAYGSYTCLAPDNNAFARYYSSFGPKFNIDSLSEEQIQYIAKSHIIDTKFKTSELQDGVFPNPNMNRRYIEIKFTNDSVTSNLMIILNGESEIVSRDNEVYNGVVHGINRVLRPSEAQLPELIGSYKELSIFTAALKLTGLNDSLTPIKDPKYVPVNTYKDEYDSYSIPSPPERKYGFTAFVETDEVFKANGINNLDDLIKKAAEWYPGESAYASEFKNRNNSLNKFISYHLIEKIIYRDKFFYKSHATQGAELYEFIETMYPNRIMKVSNRKGGVLINPDSDNEVSVLDVNTNIFKTTATVNGVFHLIDKIMLYTPEVESVLQNTRIRFDLASMFPELMNNSLRGARALKMSGGDRYGFPEGYFKYLKVSKDTRLIYLAGTDDSNWINYQGDELMGLGSYDITMRLLPVPPGTYELRYGYSANAWRSVTQIYVDNKPVGIPLDLRITASNPKIGWLLDSNTEDKGYENDKMMRNRGYMKGPTTFVRYSGGVPTTARDVEGSLRRIIGTFTFTDYEPHYVRFKSVIENRQAQLMMDYFEYVPKSVYNPSSGEPESRD